jgi:hypothetical protein
VEESTAQSESEHRSSRVKRRKQQIVTFLFCMGIATVLWFLRALENDYTTQISNPVNIEGLPANRALLPPLQKEVTLRVEGHGYSLLKHNLDFSRSPLTVNYGEIRPFPPKEKSGFTERIPMVRFIQSFSVQMGDLKVLSIKPDTLVLQFSEITTQKP